MIDLDADMNPVKRRHKILGTDTTVALVIASSLMAAGFWLAGEKFARLSTGSFAQHISPEVLSFQILAPADPSCALDAPDASRFRSWRQSPICSGSFCCRCGVMLFVVQMHISAFHLSCADQVS